MKNRYRKHEAREFVLAQPACHPDLARRIYTSRLIGRESCLVLHGGGNTSVKLPKETLLGEMKDALYIKGSGWDLATIQEPGFPALDLAYLRRLRALDALTDEEMVNQCLTHLFDSASPPPSIEALVHAFLPHRFVDHTHADAIVTLTNMAEPEARLRDILGDTIAILPWIMPGFPLAKTVSACYENRPDIEAIILGNHGIFTFAETAEQAYGRMIHFVSLAEEYLHSQQQKKGGKKKRRGAPSPDPGIFLPLLRGALTRDASSPFLLHIRTNEVIRQRLDRERAREIFSTGVLTPDHVIRTKNYPLWLDVREFTEEERMAETIASAMAIYESAYTGYFQEQVAARNESRIMLDSKPRLIFAPGLGIIGVGVTEKDAVIAADIGEHTLVAKAMGAAVAPYQELAAGHIFDMEYWSLEQAKLKKGKMLAASRPLAGRTALVTGGGGAIAVGIGRQLLAAGARVFLSDIDPVRLQRVCELLGQEFDPTMISGIAMDVTEAASVQQGLHEIVMKYGGLDILVPNAGLALVSTLAELDDLALKRALDVNLIGVFQMIKAATPIFRRQRRTGHLPAHIIINSSKNVFAPGAAFGAYSASKAGAHQLGKIAALELAEIGVRVNMINADGIFADHGISSGLWDVVGPDRMRSRNLDPAGLQEYYRNRNLLKTEVLADHVGHAVVFFASGLTPTTGATLPVDGGIAAAFPR